MLPRSAPISIGRNQLPPPGRREPVIPGPAPGGGRLPLARKPGALQQYLAAPDTASRWPPGTRCRIAAPENCEMP
jgi:hypothetical protein